MDACANISCRCRIGAPARSMWVAQLWRNVCVETARPMLAARAYLCTTCHTALGPMPRPVQKQMSIAKKDHPNGHGVPVSIEQARLTQRLELVPECAIRAIPTISRLAHPAFELTSFLGFPIIPPALIRTVEFAIFERRR
jgi:hypothetical protein